MTPRLAWAGAAALLLAVGAVGLAGRPAQPAAGPAGAPAGLPPDQRSGGMAPAAAAAERAPASGPAAADAAEAVHRQLFSSGSLQGAQPDGAWVLDGQGRLLPAIGVRQRFDQWLSTLGEVSAEQLTALVQAQARRDLGEAGAAQVMAVWNRYLQLQQQRWTVALDGHDLRLWESALAERQRVRRALLGMAWAEAFYRDEETALRQHLQAKTGQATGESAAAEPLQRPGAALLPALAQAPAAGVDPRTLLAQRSAAFGPDAALRLQAEDEAQADWARRLERARAQHAALAADAQRSPAQRAQSMAQWIEAEFSPGSERLRVRALLGL